MDSIGIPHGWEGLGITGIILFLFGMIATGRLLFRWQIDRLFQDKDKLIDTLTKERNEIMPALLKILQVLEEQAEKKAERSDDRT